MGLDARKPVFGGLWTTKAQTSLRIRAAWSVPLLFANWKVSYLDLLQAKFQFLDSFCSWGDWFESHFVGNPKYRFCHVMAHMKAVPICTSFIFCTFYVVVHFWRITYTEDLTWILLNLLNKIGKRDKMRGYMSIVSLFCNEFNKFNNSRARMLDSIYHMILRILWSLISGVKTFYYIPSKIYTVKLTLALNDTFHLTESILASNHHRIQVPKALGAREI